MLLWLKEMSGSATVMGIAMLLTNLPEVLLAPLGGVLADRFRRVHMLVGTDLASAVVMGLLALTVASPIDLPLKITALMAANMLLGCAGAGFQPAAVALIPALIQEKELERANAAHRFSSDGARILGQSLGSVFYAAIGVVAAFIFNALSFLGSAFSEALIAEPRKKEVAGRLDERPSDALLSEAIAAARLTWRMGSIRRLILHIAVFHLFVACLPIVLPFMVEDKFGLSPVWLGFFMAAFTGGVMAGFVVVGIISKRIRRRQRVVAVASVVSGAFFLLSGYAVSPFPAMFSLFGIGVSIGVIVVNLMTELQLGTNEGERGRVLGIAQAIAGVSWPTGMGLTGMLIDTMSRWMTVSDSIILILLVCGIAALAIGLSLLGFTRTAGSSPDRQKLP